MLLVAGGCCGNRGCGGHLGGIDRSFQTQLAMVVELF
jgi:hypothetical protein